MGFKHAENWVKNHTQVVTEKNDLWQQEIKSGDNGEDEKRGGGGHGQDDVGGVFTLFKTDESREALEPL